jgi:tetratricopeptide (TPR) repeat protein
MPNVPVVRSRLNWPFLFPQIILMYLLIRSFDKWSEEWGWITAIIVYILLRFLLQSVVAKDHRRGIRKMQQHKFEEALDCFKRSADFFTKNSWIDRLRFITLLSSLKMSYREISLCNWAFCLSQLGRGEEAIALYQDILKQYPDNYLASTALRMLTSTAPISN